MASAPPLPHPHAGRAHLLPGPRGPSRRTHQGDRRPGNAHVSRTPRSWSPGVAAGTSHRETRSSPQSSQRGQNAAAPRSPLLLKPTSLRLPRLSGTAWGEMTNQLALGLAPRETFTELPFHPETLGSANLLGTGLVGADSPIRGALGAQSQAAEWGCLPGPPSTCVTYRPWGSPGPVARGQA